MFSKFKHKLYISLFVSVLFMLTIIFSSSYSYISHVIERDFNKHSHLLSEQYAASVLYRISIIGEAVSCFQDHYVLYEYFIDPRETLSINAILPFIRSYNLSIKGASLISANGNVYYSGNEYNSDFLSHALPCEISEWLKLQNGNNSLQLYSYENLRGLLYTVPVQNDGKIYGYLIADIKLDGLFRGYNWSENPFFAYSSVSLSDKDTVIPIYENIPAKSEFVTFTSEIENSTVSVNYRVYPITAKEKQTVILIVLSILFLIMLGMCTVLQYFLVNRISLPLSALYTEMNDYIENIKSNNILHRS